MKFQISVTIEADVEDLGDLSTDILDTLANYTYSENSSLDIKSLEELS